MPIASLTYFRVEICFNEREKMYISLSVFKKKPPTHAEDFSNVKIKHSWSLNIQSVMFKPNGYVTEQYHTGRKWKQWLCSAATRGGGSLNLTFN